MLINRKDATHNILNSINNLHFFTCGLYFINKGKLFINLQNIWAFAKGHFARVCEFVFLISFFKADSLIIIIMFKLITQILSIKFNI